MAGVFPQLCFLRLCWTTNVDLVTCVDSPCLMWKISESPNHFCDFILRKYYYKTKGLKKMVHQRAERNITAVGCFSSKVLRTLRKDSAILLYSSPQLHFYKICSILGFGISLRLKWKVPDPVMWNFFQLRVLVHILGLCTESWRNGKKNIYSSLLFG